MDQSVLRIYVLHNISRLMRTKKFETDVKKTNIDKVFKPLLLRLRLPSFRNLFFCSSLELEPSGSYEIL